MFGVSFDSLEENRAFAEKYEFPFQLLSDPTRAMGVAYGAAATPTANSAARIGVILDREGRVLEWHAKVDPRQFPQAALDAIKA